jgi:ribosome-associated heat shock protein Hsp15
MDEASAGSAIRLDKWLWQARFCKTRGIAARMISEGAVRVNAAPVTKPATLVRVGDGLSFARGGVVHVVRILSLGSRRGPAPEARALYNDLDTPPPAEPTPPNRGKHAPLPD